MKIKTNFTAMNQSRAMKADVKRKWLEALRGGKYAQATHRLRKNDAYCCLGVLCDLYSKETGVQWDPPAIDGGMHFEDDRGILPTCVMLWAGLEELDPWIKNGGGPLSKMNDDGKTFNEIADIIEENL